MLRCCPRCRSVLSILGLAMLLLLTTFTWLMHYSSSNDYKIIRPRPILRNEPTAVVPMEPVVVSVHRYVKNHFALSLTETERMELSLDVIIQRYAFAAQDGDRDNCDADFGNGLLRTWKSMRALACAPRANAGLRSTIETYLIRQRGHAGGGDNLVLMRNVSVDLRLFSDEVLTTSVIERYVSSRHSEQPYPPFPRGFIKAACNLNPALWDRRQMPGWNADWTVSAVQAESVLRAEDCAVWIDHNVLVVQRDTFANLYHDSEDFVNTFLAMAVLGWNLGNTQILLTDLFPQGPFWEVWSQVFHGRYPPLTAWDLKQRYSGLPPGHRVCFKSLSVGIIGAASPICLIASDSPCQGTALIKAYSDFVIRGLELQDLTHYLRPGTGPTKRVVVTYMTRRATPLWPERKYCNDTHSFFKCRYWESLGPRVLGRMVVNEGALIAMLQQLSVEPRSDGKQVVINVVNFNDMSFREQVAEDLKTDIMIGPHGAGLTHSAFMRDRGALVELFIDGSGSNRHFHNFAAWYGRKYYEVETGNPINVADIRAVLLRVLDELDINSY